MFTLLELFQNAMTNDTQTNKNSKPNHHHQQSELKICRNR